MPHIVERELSYEIVGGMFEVHNELGFGFVEPIYSRSLETVLVGKGLRVEREVRFPVMFRGDQVGTHRLDMLVDGRVIVEIKSTERVPDSAFRQLRSYVTARGVDLGLLLHFGPTPKCYRVLGRPTPRTNSEDSNHSTDSVFR